MLIKVSEFLTYLLTFLMLATPSVVYAADKICKRIAQDMGALDKNVSEIHYFFKSR